MILSNPKFQQLVKLGKETMWCPNTIEIPELFSEEFIAPHHTTIKLYEDQKEVFEKVKNRTTCLIEAKMSFGKTVLAIALHQAWGGKTLIVVHTLDMAKQFKEEFEKFIQISPTYYCNGKKELSNITITTATSFRKMYKKWNDFDNVIVDEADTFFSELSIKALYGMKAKRKVGMTGTIETIYDNYNNIKNGVLANFYGYYIKAFYDENKNPLKGIYYTKYIKSYIEEEEKVKAYEWHKFRGHLDMDIDRKRAQMEYILANYNNETTLVLFDRVADVDAFYFVGKRDGLNCYKNHGQLKKEEREEMLGNFKKNGGVLFGQTATLNRGYNNIKLTRVFILYPLKKENTIQQIIGRVMRYMENKKSFVYLWADSQLQFQFDKQKPIIKKHFGLDIKDIKNLL